MAFVGRARALARLLAAVEEASTGRALLVLVSGEAGIGKSTLVGEASARAGLPVGWGTCADAERTPAFWPWTAALRAVLADLPPADAEALTGPDRAELARLLPELAGPGAADVDGPLDPDAARLRLFDAVARFLERIARHRATLIVLDDLQWADGSSLELLGFLARAYRPVPLVVVGAYRHDELGADAERLLAGIGAQGESIRLHGLAPEEVHALVADVLDAPAAQRWAAEVHRRTDGHPFFARQLVELLAEPGDAAPTVAGDLVQRRVARLTPACRALVQAAAVAGNELLPDVLGDVCGLDPPTVAALVEEGTQAGVLVRDARADRTRLAHDLFREVVVAALELPRRLALHQRIADALEQRLARSNAVLPADLARHCAAAVPLDGGGRAVRWARAAAAAERARLAFGEAAAHLARARRAIEDCGVGNGDDPDGATVLIELLLEEADARARTGDPGAARALLDDARDRAAARGDAERLGAVALGLQRLGARFAMPRDTVVEALDTARAALYGTGTALEAQLTAGLARELHHSVPAQRPRARPLSERALALARDLDDPETLAACLLARHDVLWSPGRAAERVGLAREIAELAARTGDAERHAEGLLLTANALLEEGSPAFRVALDDYLLAADRFGQPRHDYLAVTRRAALAVVDGRLDEAEELIAGATALGERIGEPDTGNVRMSQLLGLVRARGEPDRLRATAAEAVRWWVGVPSHAHAVAAGLLALAGDLDGARRALDTVVALGTWRDDRSYLWSVFVGGMATAAVRLDDRAVCAELLVELETMTDACGVNGAVVCFMGSNAHWAGILAAALGRAEDARRWLQQALAVHRRLGARVWEAETCVELAACGTDPAAAGPAGELAAELGLTGVGARALALTGAAAGPADAELRRDGELWLVRHHGSSAHLRDVKGLGDLATLLSRCGTDVHVLELAGAASRDRDSGTLLDATARQAYRRRLADLDEELDRARADHDRGRAERLDAQRAELLAELRRAAGLAGRPRALGTSTTERARKAVTARLREAIGRIGAVLPALGAHLDRSVVTGTTCRYEPAEHLTWRL
ncbi:ATP-binding protein [Pseudonocardia saturnea]